MHSTVFQHGNTYWQQLRGTAMGTPCDVAYAIIYFAVPEIRSLTPQFTDYMPCYERHVDDGFLLWLGYEDSSILDPTFERFKQNIKCIIKSYLES